VADSVAWSNDTSFPADKADAINYIMLVRAIADDVVTACCFCLHAKVKTWKLSYAFLWLTGMALAFSMNLSVI
jgi:hypothetical protein